MNYDSISRKEAIAHLKKRLYETQLNNDTEHPYYEEIADNRIDVWMNEVSSVQPEVTEEAVKEYCHTRCLCVVDRALLKKYASAQPEQKHGNWIRLSKDLAQCSECKDYIDNAISCGYNYCPNCGAEMVE